MITPFLFLAISSAAYGTSCGTGSYTDSEREAILNNHNAFRAKIATGQYVAKGMQKPSAADMLQMTWDCGLEQGAQQWANTCPSGHSGRPGVGENIYWSWSTAPINTAGTGVAASNSWQKEFQDKGWPSNNLTVALFNTGIGHATQMAWAKSNKVGCGVRQCPSSMSGYPYEVAIVCQYSPQGNFLNQNIYQSGSKCSACPSNAACDSNQGLCVAA